MTTAPTTAPTTDLLAGLLDLADSRRPPHADGPCTALCVPSCSDARDPDESLRRRPTELPTTGGPG